MNKKLIFALALLLLAAPIFAVYSSQGSYISPVITPGGKILSVNFSVTSTVPTGTSIDYFVTRDGKKYYSIQPGVQFTFDDGQSVDFSDSNIKILDLSQSTLRLKITLTPSSDQLLTPTVVSYVLNYTYAQTRNISDSKGLFELDDISVKDIIFSPNNYNVFNAGKNTSNVSASYSYVSSNWNISNVTTQYYNSVNVSVSDPFGGTSANVSISNNTFITTASSNTTVTPFTNASDSSQWKITFSTLYGNGTSNFVVYHPIVSQCVYGEGSCGNTTAGGYAYYDYSIVIRNNGTFPINISIGNPCSSIDASGRDASWEDGFENCTRTITLTNGKKYVNGDLVGYILNPSSIEPEVFKWRWRKSNIITYTYTNWAAMNNGSDTDQKQYTYANLTFSNTDPLVNFTKIAWNRSALSGTNNCFNCNGTINLSSNVSSLIFANASGCWLSTCGGGSGPGAWSYDTTKISNVDTQYIRQPYTISLSELSGLAFNAIPWSVSKKTPSGGVGSCVTDWVCINCSGTIKVPSDGSTNTTYANASGDCISESYGSEVNTQNPTSQRCSYKYSKQLNYTPQDDHIIFSNILANVSVSSRLTQANANVTCGSNSTLYTLNNSNATNFTIPSFPLSSLQTCKLYWDNVGVNPTFNLSFLNTSVVSVNQKISINVSLNDNDTSCTSTDYTGCNKINSTLYILPNDRLDKIDNIQICTTNDGSITRNANNITCTFNPTNVVKNVEKVYNLALKEVDDSRCEGRGNLNSTVTIDTLSPRVLGISQKATLGSLLKAALSENVSVNITLQDLNLTSVNISYLPNNTVNSTYVNATLSLTNNGNNNYTTNFNFDLNTMNQTFNTSVGTRVRYYIYATDAAGNLKKSDENSFFVPCQSNARSLEIRARPVSVINGGQVNSGTATFQVFDSNTGSLVASDTTAIRPEEQGGLSTYLCKQSDATTNFLQSGHKYKVVIKITSGSSTTYQVEQLTAP